MRPSVRRTISCMCLTAALCLITAGCNGSGNVSGQLEDWNRRYEEQLDKTDRQLERLDELHAKYAVQIEKMDELAKKQEQQQVRRDRLLSRWEKQADRYDRILSKWEKTKPAPTTGM